MVEELINPDHEGKCDLCKRVTMVETLEVDQEEITYLREVRGLSAADIAKAILDPPSVCRRCGNNMRRQFEREDTNAGK